MTRLGGVVVASGVTGATVSAAAVDVIVTAGEEEGGDGVVELAWGDGVPCAEEDDVCVRVRIRAVIGQSCVNYENDGQSKTYHS